MPKYSSIEEEEDDEHFPRKTVETFLVSRSSAFSSSLIMQIMPRSVH
jgi:hypothetical protein